MLLSNPGSSRARRNANQIRLPAAAHVQLQRQRVDLLPGHVRVEPRTVRTAPTTAADPLIEMDHFGKAAEDAVVHVRSGRAQVAQRRGAECVAVVDARIGLGQLRIVGYAEHVGREVREHRPVVTVAAPHRLEALHPTQLLGSHGGRVAAHVPIERRIGGHQRALEGGERPPEVLLTHWLRSTEGGKEEPAIFRNPVQPGNDGRHRMDVGVSLAAHFVARLDWFQRLRLEASNPDIPEHRCRVRRGRAAGRESVERDVQHRLAVAPHQSRRVTGRKRSCSAGTNAAGTDGEIQTVRITKRGMMAGRARDVFRTGQNRVPEQQATECDALRGGRVVRRRGPLERKRFQPGLCPAPRSADHRSDRREAAEDERAPAQHSAVPCPLELRPPRCVHGQPRSDEPGQAFESSRRSIVRPTAAARLSDAIFPSSGDGHTD